MSKSLCTPEVWRQAKYLCRMGAINKELAEFFNVCESSIEKWMHNIPGFRDAVKAGRVEADGRVANALYHRAIGYKHIAFKMFNHDGKVVTKRYVEHYAPETLACIFWLKNRRPDLWRDRQELTGKDGGPVEVKESTATEDARAIAFALAVGAEAVKNAKASGNAAGKSQEKTQ